MKAKKKVSVKQLQKQNRELQERNDFLVDERNNYRNLVLKLFKESLDATSKKERTLIVPEFIIEEATLIFIKSEPFFVHSLRK